MKTIRIVRKEKQGNCFVLIIKHGRKELWRLGLFSNKSYDFWIPSNLWTRIADDIVY